MTPEAMTAILVEQGMCGAITADGRVACILDAGHTTAHGWEMDGTEALAEGLRQAFITEGVAFGTRDDMMDAEHVADALAATPAISALLVKARAGRSSLLGPALHRARSVGGPWQPCGGVYGHPDCECRSMAIHLLDEAGVPR